MFEPVCGLFGELRLHRIPPAPSQRRSCWEVRVRAWQRTLMFAADCHYRQPAATVARYCIFSSWMCPVMDSCGDVIPLSSCPDLKMSLEWQESRETLESAASKTEDSSLKLWLESFCPELFPQFQCMLWFQYISIYIYVHITDIVSNKSTHSFHLEWLLLIKVMMHQGARRRAQRAESRCWWRKAPRTLHDVEWQVSRRAVLYLLAFLPLRIFWIP